MKSTFKIANRDVILEGNPDEIWQIILKLQNGHSTKTVDTKTDDINFPTVADITKLIEDKTDFQHSMWDIQNYYFGKKLNLQEPSEKKSYIRINRMLRTARKRITKAYDGKWVDDPLNKVSIGNAHFKSYKFVKE